MEDKTMEPHKCLPGSAWHTWQTAGYEWYKRTWATTKGALLLAANAYASDVNHENERNTKRRAFIQGANRAQLEG